ncbi:alpha/beta fold hydrolase [Kitasatospora kifunensis]|uniref:Pimeloyl-ACP methyl ester carboxylesterase n=1 Tax=Kitasatospora kifunensis TaxID=58351 RepID=A0A7W7R8F7_KITKI|nr:alpha/beta hydrolase [Kitasatospora kifunensis]MBB4927355.1 pimeloyl-ACP methyl ester carboxylesterase [Kitasatospora kifunensis]
MSDHVRERHTSIGRAARIAVGAAIALAATMSVAGLTPASAATPAPSTASASASASATTQPTGILGAPTLVAHTAAGDVGYREVGTGSPILLITGYGASMDSWSPSFVDALAAHHRVVVFDNAGVGATAPVSPPTSISAMAEQTSALIHTLRLHRPAVLGWSMGGMIGQALAVRHPAQVSHLILAATQAGTGASLPISPAAGAALNSPDPAVVLSVLFPADQSAAARSYGESLLRYPHYYAASAATKADQSAAIGQWMAGQDPAGREVHRIHVPTLVTDGASDELDPAANSELLRDSVRTAKLVLYPDAGHAFLFQDAASFVPTVDAFIHRSR